MLALSDPLGWVPDAVRRRLPWQSQPTYTQERYSSTLTVIDAS